MSLKEIEEKYDQLKDAVESLRMALWYAEEAEEACERTGIFPSHHAVMELGEAQYEAEQKLAEVESKLRELEGSL